MVGAAAVLATGLVVADPGASPSSATTNPTNTTIRFDNTLQVWTKPGERLDYSYRPQGSGAGGATLAVTAPDGEVFNCSVNSAATNSCANTDLTSAVAGIWTLKFTANPSGTTYRSFIWSITPKTDAGQAIPGRVWSKRYPMNQSTTQPGSELTLFYVGSTGYQYRATYSGYNGIDSVFTSNQFGLVEAGTCVSAYRSQSGTETTAYPFGKEPDNNTDQVKLPSAECGEPYNIFFEQPSPDLPASAQTGAGVTEFVSPAVAPAPTISEPEFEPAGPRTRAGTFTFEVRNHIGNATFRIDTNADGDFDDDVDRIIPIAVNDQGQQTLEFDGLDGLGNPLSYANEMEAEVDISAVGEIHFLNTDVELRGGLSVTALTGPETGSSILYWNDTELSSANRTCSAAVLDGRAGVNSAVAGGVHGWTGCIPGTGVVPDSRPNGWNNVQTTDNGFGQPPAGYGSWGNNRTVDDWTFQDGGVKSSKKRIGPASAPYIVTKTAEPAGPVNVGDTVEYTIEVTQQGNRAVSGAVLTDALSDVLDDASWNDDLSATAGNIAFDEASQQIDWSGDLAVGQTVSITYSVTVTAGGDKVLRNTVSSPSCDTVDGDGCSIETPINRPGFEVTKSADPVSGSAVDPGSTVTYTVTGTNTGETALDPTTLVDDWSGLLERATYNGDAVATLDDGSPTGSITVGDDALTWTGSLSPGDAVSLFYSVTINDDAAAGPIENSVSGSATPPGEAPLEPPVAGTTHTVNEPGFALEKVASPVTGSNVVPGDEITYTVTGSNTGQTGLDPVEIVDDLSGVLAGATLVGDVVARLGDTELVLPVVDGTVTWTGLIPEAESVVITYTVRVNDDAGGQTLRNVATGSATPPGGVVITPPDVLTEHPVLTPAFEFEKSSDLASGSAIDPADSVSYTLTGSNTGETVLDPVTITDDLSGVLDDATLSGDPVALVDDVEVTAPTVTDGVLTWSGALQPGAVVTVTYTVTANADSGGGVLENTAAGSATPPGGATITPPEQGTQHPINEPGLDFTKTVDPASGTAVDPGSVLTYTLRAENSGQTTLDPVTITDDLSGVLAASAIETGPVATINGEPAAAPTFDGTTLSWTGSLTPGQVAEVTYQVRVNADAGGQILNNSATAQGTPPGGDTVTPPTQETENPVNAPGFEFSKQVEPESGTAVEPGSVVTYTLRGANTGQTSLSGVTFEDDLSGVLAHSAYNGDAAATINGEPADDPVVAGASLTWSGDLAVGQSVEVTYSVTVNGDAGGQTLRNAATAQATPPGGDTIVPGEQRTETPVNLPGFSLSKTVDPDSGTRVDPGAVLTYTITGTNTGETALNTVAIDDDLAGVLDKATYNGDAVAVINDNPAAEPVIDGTNLTWSGPLAVGESVEVTFTVTVAADAGGETVTNTAQAEATPPGGVAIVPPPVTVENPVAAPSLALAKSVSPESGTAVDPGSSVTYTVVATNDGDTALDPVTVTDDLSGVLAHAALSGDPVATINGEPVAAPGVDGTTLTWAGPLAIDQQVVITYTVTVNGDAGGETLANLATAAGNGPGGSSVETPEQQTETPINAPRYEFVKTVEPASGTAVDPGAEVSYTLTGTNTGSTALDTVTISDDLAEVLTYSAVVGDPSATINGEPATAPALDETVLSWSGSLAVGESVVVTYTVQVNGDAGGQTLRNSASSEAVPPGGVTITPEDQQTETPVNAPGFELDKQVTPESGTAVDPGSVVTYTVTGTNTGDTALNEVVISDDLAAVLNNSGFNNDAAATINGADAAAPVRDGSTLTWTGSLAVGETVTLTYSVTVNADAGGQTLVNGATAEVTPPGGVTIVPDEKSTQTPINEPGFEIAKTVAPESGTAVDPGSTVTYTVTGTNTGETALDPVVVEDDLSSVLNNSAFNGDAVATINGETADAPSVTGATLVWEGRLAVGETVTITYSVTVNATAGGETLRNVVTSQATPPGGDTIVPEPRETETPINEPGFEFSKQVDPASGTAVDPGSVVTYTLTGENTGETALNSVQVSDDLAQVLAYSVLEGEPTAQIDDQPAAAPVIDGNVLTWSGALAIDETVTISYSVRVHADAGGQTLRNLATAEATPPGGNTLTPEPGETVTPVNEPGYVFSKSVDPASGTAVDAGSVVSYTLTGQNTGETVLDPVSITDDLSGVLAHAAFNGDASASVNGDPVEAPVLDGSVLSWSGSLAVGESVVVSYSVTVDADAAGETLRNVASSEATPPGGLTIVPPDGQTVTPVNVPGFSVSKQADPVSGSSVDPGSVVSYTVTGVNTGETVLDPVLITDDLSGVLAHAVFNDDAVAMVDGVVVDAPVLDGSALSWSGSLGVGESVSVTYSVTVNADAGGQRLVNLVSGEATPPGGLTIVPPDSQVEHRVNEPGFDFTKTVSPSSGTAVDAGSVVSYTLTGRNTGETVLDPVVLEDDLSGVLNNAAYNGDAAATIDGEAADAPTVAGANLTWSGSLVPGASVTVTYSVTVNADAYGETLRNAATAQATPPGGETIVPPQRETETPVTTPGFELDKTADPASGTAVDPGAVITYTVSGRNTGETVLNPVDITDDLSGVLASATYNGDASASVDGELAVAGDALTWSGSLQPGQTVQITYSVTVNADAGGQTLQNLVGAQATPPGGLTITPPDVETEHAVNAPGYEFTKSVDPASGTAVDPGAVVSYTLTGVNTGSTALETVTISDDLAEVLAHSTITGEPGATINGDPVEAPALDGSVLSWSGSLAVGESVVVSYSVTVDADAAGETLRNVASSEATPPGGLTIVPPDGQTVTPVNVPGFSVSKQADPVSGSSVDPGSVVSYTVTGVNTGETVLDPVLITDDLSGVLAHAVFNDDAVAMVDGVVVDAPVLDGSALSWSGSLGVGESVSVTYSVTVNADAGGQRLVNLVSGEATPPGGLTIVPPDSQVEHRVNEPGFDFTKTSDPADGSSVAPGEVITYTLTGRNTGETVLDPVTIDDDLSGVLGHAAYNGDAQASVDGELIVDGAALSWSGTLQPGEAVTVTYSVTVNADAGGATIRNTASGHAVPPGDDEELTPPDDETEHHVDEPGFASSKSVDPADGTEVATGDRVTYTLSGVNTGETDLTEVTLTDDLSDVFDDATYNGDATARINGAIVSGTSLEGSVLTWTGSLERGQSVEVTYSVTVDNDAAGGTLRNSLSSHAVPDGGEEIVPPDDHTENHIEPEGDLNPTGAAMVPGIATGGGLLLLIGAGLIWASRRRTQQG